MQKVTFLSPSRTTYQSGFTLIELMISLVLGLLISAAVVQIYITNARTSTVQKSGSELQDANVFGIQMLENHLRLANLGNNIRQIDDTTASGGVVLTPANLNLSTYATTDYLSRSTGDNVNNDANGWTGVSNTNIGSDQITIQFKNVTGAEMTDCEGSIIQTEYNPAGKKYNTVIERYFLREAKDKSSATSNIKNLVLACDAGRLALDASGTPIGIVDLPKGDSLSFGTAGQEFILNVDQFKVLLGTQFNSGGSGTAGNLQYISSHDYNAMTTAKPAIVSVKIGIIAHGSTPIIGSEDATDFDLFGAKNTLKDATESSRSKQFRTTYESTSLLRNARVMSLVNPATTANP